MRGLVAGEMDKMGPGCLVSVKGIDGNVGTESVNSTGHKNFHGMFPGKPNPGKFCCKRAALCVPPRELLCPSAQFSPEEAYRN